MGSVSLTQSSARSLSFGEQAKIAEKIGDCHYMKDMSNRQQMVSRLNLDGGIPQDNRVDSHALNIVQRCCLEPRGLDALLDALRFFETDSNDIEAVYETLQGILPQTITWSQVGTLKLLLKNVSLSDAAAYRFCEQLTESSNISLEGCPNGAYFSCLLDILAKLPVLPPKRAPLLEFLLRGQPYWGPVSYDKAALKEWLETVASKQEIDLDNLQALIAASPVTGKDPALTTIEANACVSSVDHECLYVLVELTPTRIHTEAEKDTYTVQAWHYRSERSKQFYTNDKPTALAAMPGLILEILDKIRPALHAAKGILTLEFLLPTSLLHYPVETWQSEEDFTIGDRYRVVVRSRDRVRAKVDNELILARWNEKRLETKLEEGWFQQFDQLTPGLRELAPLLVKTDVFCLILGNGPPSNAHERGAFLRQIVSMGMPIVLWPRTTAETAGVHREKLADLLKTCPLRLLPQKVQLRRTEGFPFTLLWDDPKHSPVKEKRLAAP